MYPVSMTWELVLNGSSNETAVMSNVSWLKQHTTLRMGQVEVLDNLQLMRCYGN